MAWLTRSFEVTDTRLGECYAPVFSQLVDGVFTMLDCPPEQQPEYTIRDGPRLSYTAPVQLGAADETVRGYCVHPTLGEVMDIHHRLNGQEVAAVVQRHALIRGKSPQAGGLLGATLFPPKLRPPAGGSAVLGDLADLNVVLVIMDAVSRLQFKRSMPATINLMERLQRGDEAAVFDMEMYGITGWHSRENQVPLLLGHDCQGLSHKAFYDFKEAEESDRFNCDSVIWPFFKARGYATAQFGDQCNLNANHFPGNEFLELDCSDVLQAKCGIDEPLMDLKNPWLTECMWYDRIRNATFAGVENSLLCINSTAMFDLAEQALHNYKDTGVPMMVSVLTSVGHNSHQAGRLQPVADKPLAKFLRAIDLSNTVVVILGDHGLHYGPHLESEQGQFEHRNPSLRMVVPKAHLRQHPAMWQALETNQHRVVSPWDVHLTLKHLTTYPLAAPAVPAAHLSKSLLFPIPADRTCAEAGIPPYACLCTVWAPIPVKGRPPFPEYKPQEHDGHAAEDLFGLAQALLDDHINNPLKAFGDSKCKPLRAHALRAVSRNKFRELGRTEQIALKYFLKLEFTAQPGDLIFAATIIRRYERDDDLAYQGGLGETGYPTFVPPSLGSGKAYETEVFHRLTSMNLAEHLVPDAGMPPEFKGNHQFCVVR